MKAISKREHTAIMAALQQLRELQLSFDFSKVPNFGKVSEEAFPADGFSLPIQTLSERFSHYEALLSQLAEAIAKYEAMYKEVRVNVVAPALRQHRKQQERKGKELTPLTKRLFY